MKSIPNGVQMQRNFLWIFLGQKTSSGLGKHLRGAPKRIAPTRPPGAPRWVVPTLVALRTPSLPYKFTNIPKPIGVNLDQKFRRCKTL